MSTLSSNIRQVSDDTQSQPHAPTPRRPATVPFSASQQTPKEAHKATVSSPTPTQRRQAFAQAIRYFRHNQSLSQEALALKAGIDRSYMGRIERAERSISLDKIGELCDALHISELEFFHQYAVELDSIAQQ